MSYKMSNEKNQELQEKASRDNEEGVRNVPHREVMDDIMMIPREATDKWAEVYKDAWDKSDRDRKG